MLYETLSQPMIFLWMFFAGILSGLIFDFKTILYHFFKKNSFFKHFFDFLSIFLIFFNYFLFNLKFNYGQIRVYSILGFILALAMQRFIIKKFVAKIVIKCYNKLRGQNSERKKT